MSGISVLRWCLVMGLFIMLAVSIIRARRAGEHRTALGIGVLGVGIAVGQLPDLLRVFGMSDGNWGDWLVIATGLVALFAACRLMLPTRRPPGASP